MAMRSSAAECVEVVQVACESLLQKILMEQFEQPQPWTSGGRRQEELARFSPS